MNIWLDDERPAPQGWVHVKTPQEAINYLEMGCVEQISLDNDLGLEGPQNEGRHVAAFIEENAFLGLLKRVQVFIHTANPIARQEMVCAIQNAERFWNGKN